VELQLERRLERGERLDRRRRARHVEDAQRIARQRRVAPGPEQLPAMDGVLDAVAADDPRILPLQFAAELLALREQARARRATQPFGDDGPAHLDLQGLAGLGRETDALHPESVLRRLVAVAD